MQQTPWLQPLTSLCLPLPLKYIDAPLVPKTADMGKLPFMPLYLDRLMNSKTWARTRSRPELGTYLLNLIGAAWRAVPAGSLEDDDDILCGLAGCDPSRWHEVRADLLRSWLRCSDGRIYNPVTCEGVRNVLAERERRSEATAKARAAKIKKTNVPSAQMPLDLPEAVTPPATETSPPEWLRGQSEMAGKPLGTKGAIPEPASVTEPPQPVKSEVQTLKEERGEEPPLAPRATTRGARLPDQWAPDEEGQAFATGRGLDPREEAAAFSDHYRASGARSPDWAAKFRAWCRVASANRARARVAPPRRARWTDGNELRAAQAAVEIFGANIPDDVREACAEGLREYEARRMAA